MNALRAGFYAGGVVATVAGLHTVIAGARSLPGRPPASPSVDGELRFYAAFYAAYGLALLRTAPRADADAEAVRALAGAMFLAGAGRAGVWLVAGKPHPLQRLLLGLELALPPGRRGAPGARRAVRGIRATWTKRSSTFRYVAS